MKSAFKANSFYSFCQLTGTTFLYSVVYLINILSEPTLDAKTLVEAFYFLVVGTIITILISHFILRKIIKANSAYHNANIKTYTLAILIASVASVCLFKIHSILFDFFIETDKLVEDVDLLTSLVKGLTASIFIYSAWCILYTAITSVRDKKLLEQQLREQQLASLVAQVNPHFLFNSLNTIRGMIYEDQDKAAELVTQLANLFRYNLSLDTKTTSCLADELKICQQYLAIESIRLGNRLQLNIDVTPESHQCKIPTTGLLILVENAVKHGIAHLTKGGTLTVTARIKNNQLIIDVINPYDGKSVKSGTKVGLSNLKQRIKLLFLERGGLSINKDNNTFHVTLNLPSELGK